MQLTIRLLGAEILHINTGDDEPAASHGDTTSYPVGFTATYDEPDEARLPDRG